MIGNHWGPPLVAEKTRLGSELGSLFLGRGLEQVTSVPTGLVPEGFLDLGDIGLI